MSDQSYIMCRLPASACQCSGSMRFALVAALASAFDNIIMLFMYTYVLQASRPVGPSTVFGAAFRARALDVGGLLRFRSLCGRGSSYSSAGWHIPLLRYKVQLLCTIIDGVDFFRWKFINITLSLTVFCAEAVTRSSQPEHAVQCAVWAVVASAPSHAHAHAHLEGRCENREEARPQLMCWQNACA